MFRINHPLKLREVQFNEHSYSQYLKKNTHYPVSIVSIIKQLQNHEYLRRLVSNFTEVGNLTINNQLIEVILIQYSQFINSLEVAQYRPGTNIDLQSEQNSQVFIILKGKVMVFSGEFIQLVKLNGNRNLSIEQKYILKRMKKK